MDIKEGKFKGKKIGDMTKTELFEVIEHLNNEVLRLRKIYDDNYDLILQAELEKEFPTPKITLKSIITGKFG